MRRSIAIGVAFTAVATAAHAWFTRKQDVEKLPLAHEWAALERCLIGEPLAERENVEQRLRMVTLGASSEADWPKRCAPYARALEDKLSEGGFYDEVSTLRRALEQDKVYYEHESFRIRTLFQLAALKVEGAVGDVSAVPAPARAKPVTGLAPLGEQLIGAGIDARDGALVILFEREGHACRLAAEGGEIAARCVYYPDAMPRGSSAPKLVPGEGPDVAVRVSLEGKSTIVYSLTDARALLEATTTGWPEPTDYRSAKGVAMVAREDDKKMTLFRTGHEPVVVDDVGERARIIGDDIVWREERGSQTILFARHVPPSGAPEARVEIGPVANGESVPCRTPAATFLWINDIEGAAAQTSHLAVRGKSGWKIHDASALAGRMFCRGARASFVAARPTSPDKKTSTVRYASCGEDGCRRSEAQLPFEPDDLAVAPLGDRLLVARSSSGVRVRVAPLKDLPTASERVVFDNDGVHGGSLVHSIQAYPVGDGAVLILHTGDGTFAIGVKADATFYPVRVRS
ncbi:MAG TPA: hypothetical protein VFB62_19980 [Polyangiaceae bacterium]|nr:hypothetical protein [Polyangiaceae bacterium]